MLHNVGGVWYERIYPKNNQSGNLNEKSFTTLFQGPVIVEKKVIAVLGFPYNGYIVRRAGGVPRHLPTKDELCSAIQFLPEDQFVAQMMEYYRRFHQSKEVRGHAKYEASFNRYELLLYPFVLHQVMTKNDCVPHGLQYYDCKYSTACKDDGARKSSGQPYVDNSNKTPKALERDCDSPDSNELFGPIWDNIDSNDGVIESRERCEPLHGTGSDHLTSEHVMNILFACTFSMILTYLLLLKQGDYDLEYSDIGYYQEELTCRSAAPGRMDLENVISQSNGNLITSAESKMNGLSHHEEDGKRKTSASEFFSFAFVYNDLNLPHFCCRQRNELAGQEQHGFDAQKCTFWKKEFGEFGIHLYVSIMPTS